MKTTSTSLNSEMINISSAETKRKIESHKKAAKYHEEAAKLHHQAVKHHEAGEHGKAALCTIQALGHLHHATEILREDAKRHASNS